MSGAPDDWDVLAGEYVLGLLDAAAAREVERVAAGNAALRAAIADWAARLHPLADTLPPAPPSERLWGRIAAGLRERTEPEDDPEIRAPLAPRPRTAPRPAPRRARAERAERAPRRTPWRGTALASLLLAAGLAAFIVWSGAVSTAFTPAAPAVALLAAPGSVEASVRVVVGEGGKLSVQPLAFLPGVPGQHMALWAWPKGQPAPVLLGTVAATGGTLPYPYPPQDGTPVMITSEPPATTPPKTPGRTLYAGLLTMLR